LITRDVLDKIWNGQIFLLGHSLGAGIAFIYNKFFDNIDKISAWAPIAYLDRYSDRQKEIWKKNGYIEFQVNQTNQTLRMNLDYLLDIENNAEKYSIIDSVKNLSIPLQIIYGQEDLTITKYERNILTSNLNHNDVSIIYINNTGHTFGYSSNKREIGKGFKEALKQTIEFFNK
ncbi:MAG: dienelactone hydrolase family protein, partial [Candidatus Woesearchaeota archaeon]